MLMAVFLIGMTLMMIAFIYIILLGGSDFHERDCVGAAFNKLMAGMDFFSSDGFHNCMERIVGPTCCNRLSRVQDYVCYQKNPILPIIYLLFVSCGFYIFANFAFPYLPFHPEKSWGISFYHKINAFGFVGACLTIFYLAMYTDPGIITEENVEQEMHRFEYDRIIYCKKVCSTCNFIRPARSKHCSACNRCVARFDHHCPWINNCVGANNVRYFLAFLLSHAILCFYGGILLGYILWAIVASENLWEMFVRDEEGGLVPITYAVVMRWLVHQHGALVGLCFALTMISVVLICFFGYHLTLVVCNTTTNETFKWQDVRRKIRYHHKQAAKKAAQPPAEPVQEAKPVEGADLAAAPSETNEQTHDEAEPEVDEDQDDETKPRHIVDFKDLVNIYDGGPISNFYEVLFPHAAFSRSREANATRGGTASAKTKAAKAASSSKGSSKAKSRKAAKGQDDTDALLDRLQKVSAKIDQS